MCSIDYCLVSGVVSIVIGAFTYRERRRVGTYNDVCCYSTLPSLHTLPQLREASL